MQYQIIIVTFGLRLRSKSDERPGAAFVKMPDWFRKIIND